MNKFKHSTHSGKELTDREFWFIHYYVQTHDVKKAAQKVGIKNGRSILNREHVIEEINYIEGNILDKAQIDTARLYKELWQIGTGVQKDPFGFDIAPADRIKALTELLKRTDDLKDKEKLLKDNAVKITITREYRNKPTEEKTEVKENAVSTE